MKFKTIIFFNYWRNGDCFINKEYVREIIKAHPTCIIKYAHGNDSSITSDLACEKIPLTEIIDKVANDLIIGVNESTETLYINTWAGCWLGTYLIQNQQDHANFKLLHLMWREVFNYLNITINPDYKCYLPSINWYAINLNEANNYLLHIQNRPLILICNGLQQSLQSDFGDFSEIVINLSNAYPNYEFLLTCKTHIQNANVTHSDDIFNSSVGNLNQISYISQYSKLIIGKNSGPFSFSHIKENILNPHKTFLCFSKKIKECLLGDGEYLCNNYFSNTTENFVALNIIKNLITHEKLNTNWKSISSLL